MVFLFGREGVGSFGRISFSSSLPALQCRMEDGATHANGFVAVKNAGLAWVVVWVA